MAHLMSQATCMTTANGGCAITLCKAPELAANERQLTDYPSRVRSLAVDWVLRTERLDEELPALVAEINARRPKSANTLLPVWQRAVCFMSADNPHASTELQASLHCSSNPPNLRKLLFRAV